jgi:hypothetical protein
MKFISRLFKREKKFTVSQIEKIASELVAKNDMAKMHEWFYQEPLNDLLARLKND